MANNPKQIFGECVNGQRHNMSVPGHMGHAYCLKCGLKLTKDQTSLWLRLHPREQSLRLDSVNPKKYGKNQRLGIRIRDRDGDNCHYCGKELTDATRTIDHYIPLGGSGGTGITNLRLCCAVCNKKKRDIPGPTWEILFGAGVCDNCIKFWNPKRGVGTCCKSKLQSYSN